ncbi:hypothetical protein D3C75_1375450 [compost metagenome]
MRNRQTERVAEQRSNREPVGNPPYKPGFKAAPKQHNRQIFRQKQCNQKTAGHHSQRDCG